MIQNKNQIIVDANSSDSIKDIKMKIEKIINANYEDQILIYDGQQLEDEKQIQDYQISNNSKIISYVKKKKYADLTIRTDEGKYINVETNFDESFSEIKLKIEKSENILVNEQRLFLNDKEIDDYFLIQNVDFFPGWPFSNSNKKNI